MDDWDVPVLHWADYLIFFLFLVLSVAIGIFYGYRSKMQDVEETAKSFLTGGSDMHYFPVALSMMASFLSAIFVLSVPAEIMSFGHVHVYVALSTFTGFGIAAHVHLPIYYRLGLTSGYEYLEMRFNHIVRVAGALTFSAMSFLYLSVVLYTPALALSQVTGLPMLPSILGVGAVCTFYTAIGGMRATIWNDAIQMMIVFACFVLLLAVGSSKVGGINKVMEIAGEGGRLDPNFSPDPLIRTTFWTHTIGGTFMNLTLYASSQTIILKFLSTKSIREGQKAIWLSSFMTAALTVMVMILGMVMYSYFGDCDPVEYGMADKTDQIVPLFVMLIIGRVHGVPGLFLASAFSAALSSVSGSVNALSAVFLEDIIHPAYIKITKKPMSAFVGTFITRMLAICFGLLTIAMSFVAEFLGQTVLQIAVSVFGMVGSPLMAILSLGMFLPWINSWGAFTGLIGSLGITCWVGFGRIIAQVPNIALPVSIEGCPNTTVGGNITTDVWFNSIHEANLTTTEPGPESHTWLWIYDLSYMYYSVLALLVATVIAIPVSLITGGTKNRTFDPRLFYFLPNECWCSCCPSWCTKLFMCCYSDQQVEAKFDKVDGVVPDAQTKSMEISVLDYSKEKGGVENDVNYGSYHVNPAFLGSQDKDIDTYRF